MEKRGYFSCRKKQYECSREGFDQGRDLEHWILSFTTPPPQICKTFFIRLFPVWDWWGRCWCWLVSTTKARWSAGGSRLRFRPVSLPFILLTVSSSNTIGTLHKLFSERFVFCMLFIDKISIMLHLLWKLYTDAVNYFFVGGLGEQS